MKHAHPSVHTHTNIYTFTPPSPFTWCVASCINTKRYHIPGLPLPLLWGNVFSLPVISEGELWNWVALGKKINIQHSPFIWHFAFRGFPWSEVVKNIKWKILGINNSWVLNCALFWVWWNLSVLLGCESSLCPAYPHCTLVLKGFRTGLPRCAPLACELVWAECNWDPEGSRETCP